MTTVKPQNRSGKRYFYILYTFFRCIPICIVSSILYLNRRLRYGGGLAPTRETGTCGGRNESDFGTSDGRGLWNRGVEGIGQDENKRSCEWWKGEICQRNT